MSPDLVPYIEHYFRGEVDDAFHGLLEMGHDILPELMEAYRTSVDTDYRSFLVNVIWERRQQSVVPFLGQALREGEPQVWKEALNGLVALASPTALDALREANKRECPDRKEKEQFSEWLEEAIEQAEEALRGG